jgi:flagellar basal body-associated protein FliL
MSEKKKKKKGKLIIIILAVVLVLGASALFFFLKNPDFIDGVFNKEEVLVEQQIQLDQFIVNLKNDDSNNNYLKTVIVFGYLNAEDALIITENDDKIRDKILQILRDKRKEELEDTEGTENLKVQIKDEINVLLGGTPVYNVYFTDFMMQ